MKPYIYLILFLLILGLPFLLRGALTSAPAVLMVEVCQGAPSGLTAWWRAENDAHDFAGPNHGTLSLNADGSFSYSPAANFNGTDSFTYKASDGQAQSGVATVTITVTPVNDAPVAANDDSYTTPEDTLLMVTAPGLLANDSDVDGDTLSAVLVTGPTHGTLTLNGDGSLVCPSRPQRGTIQSSEYEQ